MGPREKAGDVMLRLIDEKDYASKGKLDFVDNAIERSTGTIRLRALFDNAKDLFTPGMFARIQVPGSQSYQALLIPDVAIGTEQVRKFVYVHTKLVESGRLEIGINCRWDDLNNLDRRLFHLPA